MRAILVIISFLFFGFRTSAQYLAPSVVANGGGFGVSTQGSLSFTVGECVTPTAYTSQNILTQGFQQPDPLLRSDCQLYLPTAFTPENTIGLNDSFRVVTNCLPTLFQLIIFDRWGIEVFRTSDYKQGWDGKKEGRELMDGMFSYSVEYRFTNAGPSSKKRGNILIVK